MTEIASSHPRSFRFTVQTRRYDISSISKIVFPMIVIFNATKEICIRFIFLDESDISGAIKSKSSGNRRIVNALLRDKSS